MTNGLGLARSAPLVAQRARFDPARQALVGGRCDACGNTEWPARAVCTNCGRAAIATVVLPRDGELRTWSRVWIPIEGIEPPYTVGLVKIGGATLFCHVHDVTSETPLPASVRVSVDADRTPPFWVTVSDAEGVERS